MRYDTPVFFQRVLPGEYDSKTGNYAADQVTEVQKMASVMDTRAEIMQIVYGGIRQGSVTVQLQNHYQKPFDRIRIGNTKDKYIPLILGGVSIVLCAIWVLATSEVCTGQQAAMAVFTAVTQGILVAGLSNYVNQIIKQTQKSE